MSSNASIISDKNPANSENTSLKYSANSENTLLIYCADFSLNGKTIKNSAKILEKVIPSYLLNINIPILEKHGQLKTELQALKNYILKIEAQMSELKSYVKCQLPLMAK